MTTSRFLPRRAIMSAGLAWLVVPVALVCAIPVISVSPAHAGAAPPLKVPPNAELVVILATQTDAGADDKEVANWPAGQPPLALYKTRKVLQHHVKVPLDKDKPFAVKVPDGPTLTFTFDGLNPKDPKQYSFRAVLQSGAGSTPIGINARPDDRLFIAGPSYRSGTLFFGFHVLKD